jgi:hypothetical protein
MESPYKKKKQGLKASSTHENTVASEIGFRLKHYLLRH